MSILKYAYINSTISASKADFIDEPAMRAIAEATTLNESINLLKNTAYGKALMKAPELTVATVGGVLRECLLADYEKIARHVSGAPRELLEQRLKRYEVEALKTVFRFKVAGISKSELARYPWFPFGVADMKLIEDLLALPSVEDIVDALGSTEYYGYLQAALPDFEETGKSFPLVAALDKHYYSNILLRIGRLYGSEGRQALRMIGPEADIKNLIIALRSLGVPWETAEHLFIPHAYQLDEETLRSIIQIKELTELDGVLSKHRSPYSPSVNRALERYKKSGSWIVFERALYERHILDPSRAVFKTGNRFHIGVVLGYIIIKEHEIKTLVSILKMKEDKIPPPEIEKLLIFAV